MSGALRVLSSLSHDATLLPHFVKHYRWLGVERFAISIHEQRPGVRAEAEAIVETLGPGIDLHAATARQQRSGVEGWNKEELRQRVAQPDDWIIPADLDEFIQFSVPLPNLLEQMCGRNAQYVMGRFSDRLAPGGELTATLPFPNLWLQYPLEADVSVRLARCLCTKVVLSRGDCPLGCGHHFVCGPARELRSAHGIVHHFKWRAGLVEALTRRVEIYRHQKVPWVGESERVLAYLTKHGRIVPEDFNARPGRRPAGSTQ